MIGRTSRLWFAGILASIALSTGYVAGPRTCFADYDYSIRYVSATPKRGTHVRVGDHILLSVTVAYELKVADKGKIALVLQRDDNSSIGPKQVDAEVSRGSGQITLTSEFDVPARTNVVRVFVPLLPDGYISSSGEVVIEYPVRKK